MESQKQTATPQPGWNMDEFPIYDQLVTLVRTAEVTIESEQLQIKRTLSKIIEVQSKRSFSWETLAPEETHYIIVLLKLHQIFSLIKVDFAKLASDKHQHGLNILESLHESNGLNYVQTKSTPQGRQHYHASFANSFVSQLKKLPEDREPGKVELAEPVFYVTQQQSQSSNYVQLQKAYIDLTVAANGKTDLYFHGHVWSQYVQMLGDDCQELKESSYAKRLSQLGNKLKQAVEKVQKYSFGRQQYEEYLSVFTTLKPTKLGRQLEQLQWHLFAAQLSSDKTALDYLEQLLIQLLGFPDITARDSAVVYLNSLYDNTDWQQQAAFRPVIRCVGQHFKVQLTVATPSFAEGKSQLFLGLSAPAPLESVHDSVLTWHKIEERNIMSSSSQETEISINFGKFWKCGFYDWKLMEMKENGQMMPVLLTKKPVVHNFPFSNSNRFAYEDSEEEYDMNLMVAQGRFIVQAQGMRDHTFHELQIDNQNSQIDYSTQSYQRRGTFQDVEQALPEYKESGISALYLMGVFQRDNCPIEGTAKESYYNKEHSMLRKENASAFAVTNRDVPCQMLGGKTGFQSLMARAKRENIKIIVDSLARVSSSRHHRKFRSLLLSYLDADGRRNICYGTDGQAISYEDTAILNYRKKEAWELLISEVIDFALNSGVDGIHLDNGQAWPQIFQPDLEELQRVDVDGQPAYTAQEIMDAEIVIRNENYGYWHTNAMEQHANPFFIKMCRQLWSVLPSFMILGECWGGFKFQHRQIILARSGVIPRLFKLPQTICQLLGKKLHNDGRVTKADEKSTVVAFKQWYEESHLLLPEGTFLIQSSTAHSWPYPAYLYGKASWAAVDILYFMPDIPMTFNMEQNGEIYRLGQVSVHQAEQQEVQETTGLKKSGSQIRLAMEQKSSEQVNQESLTVEQPSKSKMPRVRSGSNLAALITEQQATSAEMQAKEKKFRQEVGAESGFDLSKIKSHYENRRFIRQSRMVLRYGELFPLAAFDIDSSMKQMKHDVLTYARYSLMETAIVATNLSDSQQTFFINLQSLYEHFTTSLKDTSIVVVSNLLAAKNQQLNAQDYYFLREFTAIKHQLVLNPYSSCIQIVTVCPSDSFAFQKTIQRTIQRTKEKLLNGKNIESEMISLLLLDCVKTQQKNASQFARIVGGLHDNFLDRMQVSLYQMVNQIYQFRTNPKLVSNLLALCQSVAETSLKPALTCKNVVEESKLGPIVFCAPELGRWSTVGGLGVMVDELSIGLGVLGQEVIVISPYYDRNRKGQTGYLAQDPAGISYLDNINIQLDQKYTLGVHEGIVSGVKVVFFHQSEIFPVPYADGDAQMTTRQISVFSKACLEYLACRQVIPSVCVTNDWFTGFVAGYARSGAFGNIFKPTCFLHICHNLGEDYEGRIWPKKEDDSLQWIHQLPRDWVVDSNWDKVVVNPSRCAIMVSDQWATVSKSYRDELLSGSALKDLLRHKLHPFAHPNGIPIEERRKKLDAVSPNHLHAKAQIQKKYFNLFNLDDSIPLFAFVGRITTQKGVHLILDVVEEVIKLTQGKCQFLVGGPANMRDPYSALCANRMWHLKAKYPNSFWAAPEAFFMDGSLINRGSDFGLMPSAFEPGGIVQHEFFVGATPVIAFKTGGLKDSVIEFNPNTNEGSGFTFESYTKEDFTFAIRRAINVYKNKQQYELLRLGAEKATMPGEVVCKAWLQEFFRLKNKAYFETSDYQSCLAEIEPWDKSQYSPLNIQEWVAGADLAEMDDIDFGASSSDTTTQSTQKATESDFDKRQHERVNMTFMYHNRGPRFSTVEVCGSFDEWNKRHKMQFDRVTSQWFVSLNLPPGEHLYKYVIDETRWVVNEEQTQTRDKAGNINNFVNL